MPSNEQAATDYLDIAYDVVDGDPSVDFTRSKVENKLGMDDDQKRRTLRDLENRGLLTHEGGDSYRLTLPAIHHVEEKRLDEGRTDEVDPRREERGSYVRVLFDLCKGDTSEDVSISELRGELEFEPATERRTRSYLDAAGLIEVQGSDTVRISEAGADWASEA